MDPFSTTLPLFINFCKRRHPFALVFRSTFRLYRRVLVWRSATTPLVIDKHTPWCQIENKLAPVTFWYVTDTVFKCTDKLTNGYEHSNGHNKKSNMD